MQNGNSYSTPVTILIIVGFICLAVSWLEDHFGNAMTGYVLLGLGIAGAIVIGFVLNMANSKALLSHLTQFNRDDAQIDRYRMLAFKETQRGAAAERRADAQIKVLEARRVEQLANQRAKLLTDVAQEKWQLQQQNRAFANASAADGDGDDWWTTDPTDNNNQADW